MCIFTLCYVICRVYLHSEDMATVFQAVQNYFRIYSTLEYKYLLTIKTRGSETLSRSLVQMSKTHNTPI